MPVSAVGPNPIYLGLSVLFFFGLLAAIPAYRRGPTRRTLTPVVVMAVALATAGGLSVASAYTAYEFNNTYHFGYSLSLDGNTTGPESVIVPVPHDETLLASLKLTGGTANWSFTDTPHGRGLFVRFYGGATLVASVSQFPPPANLSGGAPTMTVISNCTATPSNCTGPPEYWMFYSGTAGVGVTLSSGYWYVRAHPAVGWGAYEAVAAPPA